MASVRAWFASHGWDPWPFQAEAWQAFADGESGLIQVPTGAGKTYAAYGGPLASLIEEAGKNPIDGLRVLYITPLRAVSRDIELALKLPVLEMGLPISIESRTGDTSSTVRARQRTRLPNVLITTPESLTLLLARDDAARDFASLTSVIVDEWHELIATKRGTQVELALARLRRLSPGVRTWALSATLPNVDEAAEAVVGVPSESEPNARRPRVVRGEMARPVVIDAVLPRDPRKLPWAGHLGLSMLLEVAESLNPAEPTLLFTNTRSQAERWFNALLIVRPEWTEIAALHHGSLDREERERVEAGLKDGSIRIVVATSSLDLGVDFGPVERVFQIGSPKGVARLIQRAGRSAHRPRATARITCVPAHALELLEITAARDALARGDIEPRTPPPKPLDVLVQHLVTCALGGGFTEDELFQEIRSAYSFRDLTQEEFTWALELVKHGGKALAAYPDFQRVALREGRYRVPTPRLALLHRMNVGTITADATVDIRYVGGRSLGRIEENFVSFLRVGQSFMFAGKLLTFVEFRDDAALVRPGSGQTTFTPTWYGTKLPISESLSGAFRRVLYEAGRGRADTPELAAARELIQVQLRESIVPSPEEILAEVTTTREGTHLCVFPFEGRLVNAGLAGVLALRLTRLASATFTLATNDYGFEIICPEAFDFGSVLTPSLFSMDNLTLDAMASADSSLLMKLQFREIARVAGLVTQSMPGRPRSGKHLQVGTSLLFDVLSDFDPGNLLLTQARREVLERHYEKGRLGRTMQRLASGALRIVQTARPTPLSFPLMVERLAGRLSSETMTQRVQRMRDAWSQGWSEPAESASTWDDGLPMPAAAPEPTKRRTRRGSAWRRPPGRMR